jgi:hypothetical protein
MVQFSGGFVYLQNCGKLGKYGNCDFLQASREHSEGKHVQSLDRGFSGWRDEKWASIVLCLVNSTQSFPITVPRYTNWQTNCRAGGGRMAIFKY